MIKSTTKVSVVVCTYNGAKYLCDQLDSILNQTYPIYEIIVQDDKSTDDTCKIVLDYQRKFHNIKLYKNDVQKWPSMNFATAFKCATGDVIAPCDQDDIWLPHKIEKLLGVLGDKNVAYSNDIVWLSNGNRHVAKYGPYYNPWQFVYSFIPGHTMVFRKEMVMDIFAAVESGLSFDYSIALLGILRNSIIRCNEELQIWRRHDQSVTKGVDCGKLPLRGAMKKYQKFLQICCIFKLLIGAEKSIAIKRRFNGSSKVMLNTQCIDTDLLRYCKLMSKQSLFSMIVVGIISMKHSNDIFCKYDKILDKVKSKLYAFRFPLIFWYTHRNEIFI